MASDRIGETAANLVAVPPYEIVSVDTNHLFEQPQVMENIEEVPVNQPLIDSIKVKGILNPFLCMKMWWPIAGSQRIRAVYEIKKEDPDYNLPITVHRFYEDWHNCFYLWGDEEFRSQAIAIWFQMQEAVFKSLHYEHTKDGDVEMTFYEDLGEELKWKHDES